MASLEDFSFSLDPTLEDLAIGQPLVPPVRNNAANLNLATHAAMLAGDPEGAVDTYRAINAELETEGTSPTFDQVESGIKEKAFTQNQRTLVNILADPELSDEQKMAAAQVVMDRKSAGYEINNLLSGQMLAEPDGDEDVAQELLRTDMASSIQEVNRQKYEEQLLFNAEMAKQDQGLGMAAVQFAELMAPFIENVQAAAVLSEIKEGDPESFKKAILFLGDVKAEIGPALGRMPPEKRLEVQQALVPLINDASSILFQDGNDWTQRELLSLVLQQGSYDSIDQFIDNTVSLLDMTLLGGAIAKTGQVALRGTKAGAVVTDSLTNLKRRLVKSQVQPATVSQNLKDVNAEKARAVHDIVVADESGEAAQAFYGATREDALSNDLLPEILNPDGTVIAKVADISRNQNALDNVEGEIIDAARSGGRLDLLETEKASARGATVERFRNAIGMDARHEMFQIANTGDGVNIRAVYGPPAGGFTSAEDALAMARLSLRNEGVTEDQIKLLVRDGSNYRVAETEEVDALLSKDVIRGLPSGARGFILQRQSKDFLIMVDHKYEFDTNAAMNWDKATVTANWLVRFVPTGGSSSFWANLVDRASMFGEETAGAAVTAVDRSAYIEKSLHDLTKNMADKTKKSSRESLGIMDRLIKEANDLGKEHSYTEMVAAGLTPNEIEAMQSFRKFWDTVWVLENADRAKSLRHLGFAEVIDEMNNTQRIARPVHKNQVGSIRLAYDSSTGQAVKLTDTEVKDLYEQGGQFAKLDDPIIQGDKTIEHILVKNRPGESYLRAITNDTRVLNYRKGYSQVIYKDPHFIVKKVGDKTQAIATAGSKADAAAYAKSLAAREGKVYGVDYFERGDLKGQELEDSYWQVQKASGRSAQRTRGERLVQVDSRVTNPEMTNIVDPVSSMIIAARSISARTSMRDLLETMKGRFMSQYEDFLDVNEFGQKVFPDSPKGVRYRGKGLEDKKALADALATHEYIKYLEDGYGNAIDEFSKAALKNLADFAGAKGLSKVEAGFRWAAEGRGPSALAKSFAFQAYLGTAPLRQFVIQSHQFVQLASIFPGYMSSGRFAPQAALMVLKQFGLENKLSDVWYRAAGWSKQDLDEVFKDFQRTGQVAAIDKQNMVRGSLLDFADSLEQSRSKLGRAWRLTTLPLTWSRKLGFDAGEYVSTMTSYIAHRHDAVSRGADLSNTEEKARVAARARNFTYNMNAAGDFKYNQTSLSAIFQFMQVPHKVMLTMLTNRQLSKEQKMRLFLFNATMYTLPTAAMISWFGEDGLDVLPEGGEAREAVIQGLEGYTLNKLISLASGKKVEADWSSLSPLDIHGMMDFVHGLFTTDFGEIFVNSPSGQLFGGNSPRISNALWTMARFFNVASDDPDDPTTFGDVVRKTGQISSGFSAALKARMALDLERRAGTLEGTSNSVVEAPQAILYAFGIGSMDEARARYLNDKQYQRTKEFKEDMRLYVNQAKQMILDRNPNVTPDVFADKAMQHVLRAMGDSKEVRMEFDRLLEDMYANKDVRIIESSLNYAGILGRDGLREVGNTAKFRDEEQRKRYMEVVDFLHPEKVDSEEE